VVQGGNDRMPCFFEHKLGRCAALRPAHRPPRKEATSIRRRHSERHREAFCRDPRRMPKNLRIV
jgi:hypothetical protein